MRIPAAIDAETDEVLGWVLDILPARGKGLRVLEVGCGPGHLAARLVERGVDVVAIDPSEKQVNLAQEHGVSALRSDFLSFGAERFDALLFTRSLHHISPLPEAIRKMRSLLRPGGWILADEFAHEEMNPATAAWFWDLQAVLELSGALAPDTSRRHHHQPQHEAEWPSDPLERWRERHVHDPPMHGAATMMAALRDAFTLQTRHRLPYLHRYLSDRVADSEQGKRLFLEVRELEALRIAQGLLVPIGLRLVARL